jgi:hypothetical protein
MGLYWKLFNLCCASLSWILCFARFKIYIKFIILYLIIGFKYLKFYVLEN